MMALTFSHVHFSVTESEQENDLESCEKKSLGLGNVVTHGAPRAAYCISTTEGITHAVDEYWCVCFYTHL